MRTGFLIFLIILLSFSSFAQIERSKGKNPETKDKFIQYKYEGIDKIISIKAWKAGQTDINLGIIATDPYSYTDSLRFHFSKGAYLIDGKAYNIHFDSLNDLRYITLRFIIKEDFILNLLFDKVEYIEIYGQNNIILGPDLYWFHDLDAFNIIIMTQEFIADKKVKKYLNL